MNILSVIVLMFCSFVIGGIFIYVYLNPGKHIHNWSDNIEIAKGNWYYHEYTMPQLPDDVIKCYRQDVTYKRHCTVCGKVECIPGYNQKIHESDTMHRTPPDFVPEKAPEGLSEAELDKLQNRK